VAKKPSIPELTSIPAYAASAEKLVTLQRRRKELSTALDYQCQPVALDDRARALIENRTINEPAVPDAQQLRSDIRIVDRAIELQTEELEKQKRAAGNVIRKQLLPIFREQVAAIDAALSQLQAAIVAHQAFRDELETKGINPDGSPFADARFIVGRLNVWRETYASTRFEDVSA
jgi:hypothetical protein